MDILQMHRPIVVEQFMHTCLGLRGDEEMVFAFIYGMRQEPYLHDELVQELSEYFDAEPKAIQLILESLGEKCYIAFKGDTQYVVPCTPMIEAKKASYFDNQK